jgi:hypothetical protein
MEDIVWNRIKVLSTTDISLIHYFKLDKGLDIIDYNNIEQLYLEFVYKHYLNSSISELVDIFNSSYIMKNINNDTSLEKFSLFIGINEPELSTHLEEVFNDNISFIEENLILFYKRGEEKLLILFKSFYPLSYSEKISLPHFCLYLSDKKTIEFLETLMDPEENFVSMNCTF